MVELRNVTKNFGSFKAVDDVSLAIRPGEFLTLLGPSGCGKTTLLRMISGFESPDAGAVWLDEKNVTRLPPYRRDVNQVFQSYALFPHLSVRDNIAFGLRMRRLGKSAIATKTEAAIELVSLGGLEDRKPNQLSGGQRQRVALARALVCEPKVLLLDEPLAALDAKLRRAMQVELKRLQHRVGITFVFVTHDQEEALTMSDRIAVMNQGKIEQLGTAIDVYRRPATAFVASFLGQANLLPARRIDAQRISLADGTQLYADCGDVDGQIVLSIRPEKIEIHATRPEGENVLQAEVVEEIFKGAFDQLLLRVGQGIELTAVVPAGKSVRSERHVYCKLWQDDLIALRL
jgi:spermidine/putrescine transport system ATP-binding protein